jgi:autotransporter-associated beta strand protein
LGNVNAVQNSTLNTGTVGSQAVTFTVAGTNTYNLGGLAGADDLAIGANTISVGSNNATTSFTGAITSTGGGLTKVGTGNLTLTGTNTYTGNTTISAGTLEAGAAGALGTTTAITVTTTGTLLLSANSATSGNALTMSNGTVALIKTGTGVTNTLGALTLTENSVIDFGNISSGNNILTLGAVTSWTSGKFIEIWNWSGNPTGGGTDQLWVSGDKTVWEANLSSISFYSGSGGGTLIGTGAFVGNELVAVPEPATWSYMATIALGGAILVIRRRRMIGSMKDEV